MAEIEIFNDGPVKPVRIWSRIGRRPLVAGGNSNGDVPMLRRAGERFGFAVEGISLVSEHHRDETVTF